MRIMYARLTVASWAAAVSLVLAGCGGGGSPSSQVLPAPQIPVTNSKSNATATIVIPARAPSANNRRPQWISPLTMAVDFTSIVNGQTVAYTFAAVTPASPNCSPTPPAGTTCTVSFAVVPGQQNIVVNLYDNATFSQASVLATTTQSYNLIGGINNPNLNFVLNAVPALIFPTSVFLTFTGGTSSSYNGVAMSTQDIDGEDISGIQWDAPIPTTLDDTTNGIVVSQPSISGGSGPLSLNFSYTGNPNTASSTINWCSRLWLPAANVAASCPQETPIVVNVPGNSLYVTGTNGNVNGFAPLAGGPTAAAPVRSIPVNTRNLANAVVGGGGQPAGIVSDGGGTVYYAEPSTNAVVRTLAGSGNTSPLTLMLNTRALQGSNTTLNSPVAVAFDNSNHLWVSNSGASSLLKFNCCAGNLAPVTTITSASMNNPRGIAIDQANNNIYVLNGTGTQILEFAAAASGNSVPTATISTGLANATGIAVHGTTVYVANAGNNSVTEYPTGLGSGPSATISGAATGLSGPTGIAVDATGNIYVSNNATNAITKYAFNATGNAAPTATLSGAATTLSAPAGIAIRP